MLLLTVVDKCGIKDSTPSKDNESTRRLRKAAGVDSVPMFMCPCYPQRHGDNAPAAE